MVVNQLLNKSILCKLYCCFTLLCLQVVIDALEIEKQLYYLNIILEYRLMKQTLPIDQLVNLYNTSLIVQNSKEFNFVLILDEL